MLVRFPNLEIHGVVYKYTRTGWKYYLRLVKLCCTNDQC